MADLVLAITSDDRMLHTGTRGWVLDHVFGVDPGAAGPRDLHRALAGPDDAGLELFDDGGHALRLTDDGVDLVPVGAGDADPDVLVTRIAAVLDRAREHLASHPELDVPPSVVPWVGGPLPEVLALLDGAGSSTRPARHVPPSGLRGWLVAAGTSVWAASTRRAPDLIARVSRMVGRLPGLGGAGGPLGDPGGGPLTPPITPPIPPYLPPDGVPHNGSWFHNLMHRLRD